MTDTRHNIAILQRWVNSDGTERECARCGETYHLPPSYEASAMCNACAQWFVAEVAPDLLEIVSAALVMQAARVEYMTDQTVTCGKLGEAHAVLEILLRKVRP